MKTRESLLNPKSEAMIQAAAAMAANGAEALDRHCAALRALGAAPEEIAMAIHIGQAVKERPAEHMKEVADVLVDTKLVDEGAHQCPASQMDPTSAHFRLTMLVSAGAAMAANCEPCLNQAVPFAVEAGVSFDDLQRSVLLGLHTKEQIKADLHARIISALSAPAKAA